MSALVLGAALGAVLTLAVQVVVQFYVVPRVESRKRQEDRWERDVRELGELLTTSFGSYARELRYEQSTLRALKQMVGDPNVDSTKVAEGLTARTRSTLEAVTAFSDLAQTRVDWLAERVQAFMPTSVKILRLQLAMLRYYERVQGVIGLHRDGDLTDATFDQAWEQAYAARDDLIKQVRLLANLPHPPRASLRLKWKKRRLAINEETR